ncbi:MAG: helix-turn-helix domain-containing protein [Mucilaginibacter sp.]
MKILHKIHKRYGTQKAMAKGIGVSQATVSDWLNENKPMSPDSINLVAKKEGIRPGDLFEEIYPAS